MLKSWKNLKLKSLVSYQLKFPLVLILLVFAFVVGLSLGQGNFQQNVAKTNISQTQEVEGLKINVTQAHLSRNIRLAQKNSNAPEGKNFLVIFTEPENASSSAKQVNFGDLFRLEENGKKLAPLPINSQFTIPAQASLEKQVVFIVNSSKTKFRLLVGSLNKEQKVIEINF